MSVAIVRLDIAGLFFRLIEPSCRIADRSRTRVGGRDPSLTVIELQAMT